MKPSGQRAREAIQFEFLPQLVVVQRKGREWIEARKQSQSQGFRIREEPAPLATRDGALNSGMELKLRAQRQRGNQIQVVFVHRGMTAGPLFL